MRWNGRVFEALAARLGHRHPRELYHSALVVRVGQERFVVEMTPAWGGRGERGVVGEGAVGARWLGCSRLFRYEVRRWRSGAIPDVAEAVASPQRVSGSEAAAQRVLDLVPDFPLRTWGRDEQEAGDMWNSNSLTAWLLARSGHDTALIGPPARGRAPGWEAGLVVAGRQQHEAGMRLLPSG